jgi:hypothetical protein
MLKSKFSDTTMLFSRGVDHKDCKPTINSIGCLSRILSYIVQNETKERNKDGPRRAISELKIPVKHCFYGFGPQSRVTSDSVEKITGAKCIKTMSGDCYY